MPLSRILAATATLAALLIATVLISRVSHAVARAVDYVFPPPAVRVVNTAPPQRVIIDRPTQSPSIPTNSQADPLP